MRAEMRSAAASIKWRVGVDLADDVFDAASAPSQCVVCVNSGPATPGKKYFAPPAEACDFVWDCCAEDEHGVVNARRSSLLMVTGTACSTNPPVKSRTSRSTHRV